MFVIVIKKGPSLPCVVLSEHFNFQVREMAATSDQPQQYHHPPPTSNEPIAQPIAVIGPQYLAPYPVDLTVTEKTFSLTDGDYAVTDVNGNIVFKIKGKLLSLRDKRTLVDAAGNVLITMRQKVKRHVISLCCFFFFSRFPHN